jgi:uncharacterized protein
MGIRSGSADLPLHGGRVPPWLAERMAALGRVVVEAVVLHFGRDEVLRRLSHPFWFQSLGAVMGMDWHSSGITTSVLGALKRGLWPVQRELGLYVCGGRGRHSRKTPSELTALSDALGLDGKGLVRASRLVAKVDSAAVQDGFQLYLHGFIVAADGKWTVVQQGMNAAVKTARRYHWHSEDVRDFVDAPHSAIEGESVGEIVNLADHAAKASREAQVKLLEKGPDALVKTLTLSPSTPLRMNGPVPNEFASAASSRPPQLCLPFHHDVRSKDVVLRRLHGALKAAADAGPRDFSELLLVPGVGARTVFSLAQVAEVIHGAPYRFSDPARFSLAHGGKDGHPFPVPLKVYDQTLSVMRDAIARAKLGQREKLDALERLTRQAQLAEAFATGPSFDAFVSHENAVSYAFGGRTVSGDAVFTPQAGRGSA